MSYDARLDEIERRLLACRLPWALYGVHPHGPWQVNSEETLDGAIRFVGAFARRGDALFAAHAPDDVRWLLAELRAARAILRSRRG